MGEEQQSRERMSFSDFVDKGFWMLITAFVAIIAKQAVSIHDSVDSLNSRVASVMEKVANQEKRLDDFGSRLMYLENPSIDRPQRRPGGR